MSDVVFYSQYEDELIIQRILDNLGGPVWKTCWEAGGWDGIWLSNTAWLIRHCGWTGTFVEADGEKVEECRQNYEGFPVSVIHERVTAENINDLVPDELDVLSLDIDGNDYWVFQALKSRPRIAIVEYNPRKLGLDVYPYDPDFVKNESNLKRLQATIASLILLAEERAYRFVGADIGCNAFFVPEELFGKAVRARVHNSVHGRKA